jgi:hypothetical protein
MKADRTRATNLVRKARERARRDARMLERVRSGSPPYAPEVMSWLSRQLGIPSNRIRPEDVAKLSA